MPPRRSERSAPVRPAHAGAAPLNPASSAGSAPLDPAVKAMMDEQFRRFEAYSSKRDREFELSIAHLRGENQALKELPSSSPKSASHESMSFSTFFHVSSKWAISLVLSLEKSR